MAEAWISSPAQQIGGPSMLLALTTGAGVQIPGLVASDTYNAATAAANTAAFQVASNSVAASGGRLSVITPGTYWFAALDAYTAIYLASNTTLFRDAGVIFKMAPNANVNFVRNLRFNPSDGSGWQAITSLTTADGATVTAVLAVAPSASLIGTTANKLINGAIPDDFNGVYLVTYTASGFTYIRDRTQAGWNNYTATATFNSVTGVTATMTNGSAIVTGLSTVTGVSPGMDVVITAGAATIGKSRVNTLDSVSQIALTGALPVCSGSQAVTLKFQFPIQCCDGDVNIHVIGGKFDHNQTNQSSPDSLINHCVHLRGVARVTVRDVTSVDSMAAISAEGIYDSTIDNIWTYGCTRQSGNGMYPVKHSGRNVTISRIYGSSRDDFVSIIGKEYSQYMDMGSPFGLISVIRLREIEPSGCLSAIKLLPVPNLLGPSMDDISISGNGGRSSYTNYIYAPCYDLVNTGVYTGGTFNSASGKIGNLRISDFQPSLNPNGMYFNANAQADLVSLSNGSITGVTATGRFIQSQITAKIGRLRISNFRLQSAASALLMQLQGSTPDIHLTDVTVEGGGGGATLLKYEASGAVNNRLKMTNCMFDGIATAVNFAAGVTGNILETSNVEFINPTSTFFNFGAGSQIQARFGHGTLIPQGNFATGSPNSSYAYWSLDSAEPLTSGASVTIDMLKRPNKCLTMSSACQLNNPINPPAFSGANTASNCVPLDIMIAQNATGSWALTFDTQYKFPVAVSGTPSAGTTLALRFQYDGQGKWVCTNSPVWI